MVGWDPIHYSNKQELLALCLDKHLGVECLSIKSNLYFRGEKGFFVVLGRLIVFVNFCVGGGGGGMPGEVRILETGLVSVSVS